MNPAIDPEALWSLLREVAANDIRVWGRWIGDDDRGWRLSPTLSRSAEVWREGSEYAWAVNLVGKPYAPDLGPVAGRAPTMAEAREAADARARASGVLLV